MHYRKIYSQHYGEIPKGYHIHHIDGDHSNNCIENLKCVSIQEHYDIHYSQGDYGACWAMSITGHISLTVEERSELSYLQQISLIKEGKHPWQTREDGSSQSLDNRDITIEAVGNKQRELVFSGKHHFLSINRDPNMEQKRSETVKKKYEDPIFKETMRKASLGRTWKLDPETAKKVSSHITPFTSETAKICKDTIWINDGIKNKRIKKTNEIPEGFTKGRKFVPWNKRSNIQ